MSLHAINPSARPEHENDGTRATDLGYEPRDQAGLVRYVEHGFPHPLVRWHVHAEYELHLITSTRGKAFVGDYIGSFEPGHLVLVGPHLPHNWVTTEMPAGGVELRDQVVQFCGDQIEAACASMPELREVQGLLRRAQHGVEFFGISDAIASLMTDLRDAKGLARLSLFIQILERLSRHDDARLLSSSPLKLAKSSGHTDQISRVLDHIAAHFEQPMVLSEVAAQFGMSESNLSRHFRRGTGNTFTDFVNQVRINKACELLANTDQFVSTICFAVGFNNVANFNRRFMEYKNMTPSEFRKTAALRLAR